MAHEDVFATEPASVEIASIDLGETVVTALDNSTTVTVVDPRATESVAETTITVEEYYDLQVLTVDRPGYGGGSTALGSGEFKFIFTLEPSHEALELSPGIVSVPIISDYEGPILGVTDIACFIDGRRMNQNRGWRISSDGLFLEIFVPTEGTLRQAYFNSEIEYVLVWTF